MLTLSPAEYDAILRSDLGYFAQRCFCELNPQAAFAMNWHIEVIVAKLTAVREGKDPTADHQPAAPSPEIAAGLDPLPGPGASGTTPRRPLSLDPGREIHPSLIWQKTSLICRFNSLIRPN